MGARWRAESPPADRDNGRPARRCAGPASHGRAAPPGRRRAVTSPPGRSHSRRRGPSGAAPRARPYRAHRPAGRPATSARLRSPRPNAARPGRERRRSSLRSRRVEVRRRWTPSLLPCWASRSLASIRDSAVSRDTSTACPTGSPGLTRWTVTARNRCGPSFPLAAGVCRSSRHSAGFRCGISLAADHRDPRRLLLSNP